MPPPRRRSLQALETEVFVGRNEIKRSFEDAVFGIRTDGCSLRTFYGVGGQGKTALARELFRISSSEVEPNYSNLRRAMLDLHGRPKADPDLLLVWIRNEFAKVGVSFPAFDLAFAIMWQKTKGEAALPIFENAWLRRTGDILGEAAPDAVIFIRDLFGESAQAIPVLGVLATRGSKWVFDKSKGAYLEKTRPQLQELYSEGQLIADYQMSEILPWMLAQDLNTHLEAHPDDRFVLFIDEYESVFKGAGIGAKFQENRFDKSLRTFIPEANALLAIFFSRERLPWEADPDWGEALVGNQTELTGLADDDALAWLKHIPVEDDAVCAAMITGARETSEDDAQVYPLLMDIQVAHWRNLGVDAKPQSFDVDAIELESRRLELVQRLLRDYEDPTQQVLILLSVVHRFDRIAFEHVVKEFNISVAFDHFDILADLSIMTRSDDGWLSTHRAIAEAIVASSEDTKISRSQNSLIDHFVKRANPAHPSDVGETTMDCLWEAKTLRIQGSINGYCAWLNKASSMVNLSGKSSFLEGLWREALNACKQKLRLDHADTATCYDKLAYNLNTQGKLVEAEPFFLKALEIRKSELGMDHTDTAESYHNVASSLNAQGKTLEAEPFFLEALEIRKSELGMDHTDTAKSYNGLAFNLDDQGEVAEAERLYREAIKISERAPKPNHTLTATIYNNLALNLNARGETVEAEELLREALKIRKSVLGPDNADTAASYNSLASNLNTQGKIVKAETPFRKALEIRERALGPDHPDTVESYANLALNLKAQHKTVEGIAKLFECVMVHKCNV
ncbi:MAG: tetratricopeptide repeat protein [Litoreibacter sp.]